MLDTLGDHAYTGMPEASIGCKKRYRTGEMVVGGAARDVEGGLMAFASAVSVLTGRHERAGEDMLQVLVTDKVPEIRAAAGRSRRRFPPLPRWMTA